MRIGIAAVVLASCAPKPPEPLEPMRGEAPDPEVGELQPVPDVRIAAPRPDVDVSGVVPDIHEELRWPLTAMSHPSLEPRFGVAAVFAEAGVGWLELCKRGVHKRTSNGRNRDELEYLRGWCGAVAGDAEAACSSLRPLTHSTVLGMSAAVRIDLANIIANAGHIDKAEHLIAKFQIDDPEVLDTLAATYVEVGAERDAYEINRRAIDVDARASQEVQCRRLIKQIVLGPEGERAIPIDQLEQLATKPKVPDRTCVELHDAWTCYANPKEDCYAYFTNSGIGVEWLHVLRAYHSWPRHPVAQRTFLRIVDEAKFGVRQPAGLELMLSALEAAARAPEGCLADVHAKALEIETLLDRLHVAKPARLRAVVQCGQ